MYKKAIDNTGLDVQTKEYINSVPEELKTTSRGVACGNLLEPVPRYINAECEKVISNKNNAWIVLGRDRPTSRLSGYGGLGDTHAASIDIVVGRMGYRARKVDAMGNPLSVDPNFKTDAARIYISQKTDIDTNFGLPAGAVGNIKAKSAIGLKADNVRIIGREGIKLVTKTDLKNSQGSNIREVYGVDIIAGGNDKELQPMVKGQNLQVALERIVHHVDKLAAIVDNFLMSQMVFNSAVAGHFHYSPFFGICTTPSEILIPEGTRCAVNQLLKVKRSLVAHKMNLAGFKMTYLNPAGSKYINSRHNNVN